MKRIFFTVLFFAFLSSLRAIGADYYVAPDGNDANAGTISSPFRSLQKAILLAAAGDYIYLRGGVYYESTGITVARGNDGTAVAPKHIYAYAGETPVLNFSAQAELSNNRGLTLNGHHWHVKGIIVEGAGDNGIFIGGNNNTVEKCVTRRNRDTGLQLGRYSSSATTAEWPSNNLIVDCESYDNKDASNENADGFACKLTTGPGNIFRRCIAHHNIDDGWDLYTKTDTGPIGAVTLEDCIAHSNGTLTTGGTSGNGDKNGFKLGGEGIPVNHIVRRCIAFNNGKHGFTYNSNPGSIEMSNCTGYKNAQRNFSFDAGTHVYKNNLSYLPASNDKVIGDATAPNAFSNDAKWGFSVTASSFQSLTPGPDANPTANGFLHLAQGSPLIDAGVLTTGISYSGSAPDLGAVEFGGTTNPPVTTYTLSVSASPASSGTVTKNPDRSGYTADESVVLTATPASGYVFSGWSGDASGTTNPLTITMSSNKTITALFTAEDDGGGTPPAQGLVTIAATATPATGLCSFDGSLRQVGSTYVINLSNTAGKGVNWKAEVLQAGTYSLKWRYAGGGSTAQETARLLINGTEAIAAVPFPKPANSTSFLTTEAVSVSLGKGVNEIRIEAIQSLAMGDIEWLEVSGVSPKAADCSAAIGSGGGTSDPVTYTVTTVSTPAEGGTISLSPAGGTYTSGTVITATATPAEGYEFTGWSGDATGTNTSTGITVNGNKTITANFSLIDVTPVTYQLTTSVSGQGTVSPVNGTFTKGETATLTATPAEGWRFTGWSGDASGAVNPLTLTMNGNKSVTAVFAEGLPPVVDSKTMIGYAATSGEGYTTTTGGVVAGQPCKTTVISTLAQLQAWALSREKNTTPEVVYISGKISASSSTVVTIKNGANVSVLGLGSTAELQNVGLNFRDYKNVIVRNLKIHEVFYPNDGLTIDNCQHVWVDHCEFHSIIGPGIGVDTYDGLLDIKNGSRYVTVSWSHFHHHMKTVLIGHTDNASAEATDRQIRVTFHHNFFENTDGRNPSLRWGAVHMFNNYLKDITDYGIAARQGAHALLENNVYENVKLPISTNKFDGEGYVCESGNLFTGTSGPNSITQTGCEFWNAATLPYAYILDPVESVTSIVPANVGVGKIDVSEACGSAPPPAVTYQLTTSVTGQGTVSPANGTFNKDESVVLTATPASGYVFSGWSGDASGTTNPLTITMSGNKSITALFTAENNGGETPPASGSVTIAATATPATGLCSFEGSLRAVGSTSVINLSNTAGKGVNWKVEVPQAGTYSLKWRYAGGGSTAQETARLLINGTEAIAAVPFPKPANSTSFLITEAVSVSLGKGVNEIRIEAIQSLAMGDIEWLEVSGVSPKAADCSAAIGSGGDNQTPATYTLTTSQTGQGVLRIEKDTYGPGETATLTAIPAEGWRFTGWSGDASGTINPLTITMDGNKTVSAVFAPKLEQTISFVPLAQKTVGDAEFDGAAVSTSGLAVSLSSSNTGVAIIADGLIRIIGAGTAVITASQSGDDTYLAASPVSQELTVVKKEQTITFGELPQKYVGDTDFDGGATASSGLVISYSSSNENVATVVNGLIHIVGSGTAIITASQSGDYMYNAAAAVSQELTVVKKEQFITFGAIDEKKTGDYDFDPAALASSGLPVSYNSSNTSVAIITDGKIRIIGAGTAVITAVQEGNNRYDAAASVSQTLTVIQLLHTPFGGEAVIITGGFVSSQRKSNLLEAEDYDEGGQGVAYHDRTMPNTGRQYRLKERVDVDVCSEGGYAVTDNEAGEWLKYTVRVLEAGTYNVGVRVASQTGKGRFRIEIDGKEVSGVIAVPATGGMNSWSTVVLKNISLKEGLRVIKVLIEDDNFKINYFTFTTAEANSVPTTSVKRQINKPEVEESAVASVTLYPNPASDLLNIRVSTLKAGATVQVYTAGGVLVRSERLSNTVQTLLLKGLAAGSYYVQVRNGDQLTSQKIIKSK